ncbi:c-type cytochrome [Algihabitans albus]|uniref:c-type cytochrome n=1 Tax=Algihabitans albus TaxID=2164067 RepID=UPI000E5D81AD|nr:cytochrome c [Algihabitans albus]
MPSKIFPIRPASLAAILLMAPGAALASPADEGEALALENCAKCHEVSGESFGGPRPTLYEIAGHSRYWTPTRFDAWLSTTHGPMPQFRMTSQDIYNLMQYLERLRSDANLAPSF